MTALRERIEARGTGRATRLAAAAGLGVALVVAPFALGSYWTWLLASALLLALFAVSFNLLFGFTGLLSFGHAMFFAIGGYVSALTLLWYASLPLALVLGVAAAAAAGLVIGFLCLRHTDIYFAMLTLAFGMMVHSTIWRWRGVTGGDDGLRGVPRGVLGIPGFGLDVSDLTSFYFLVLVVSVAGIALLWRIVQSPTGLALQGIRDNEARVAYAGLPVRRLRLVSFTLSALFSGLAGALWTPLQTNAGPSIAHWTFSAEPVLASLLGGAHAFAGPIVGAFLLFLAKQYVLAFTQYWLLVLGLIVVALVLAFRGGVVSVVQDVLAPRAATVVRRRLGRSS
jgi:branched-chain amino acid transport system permease protein